MSRPLRIELAGGLYHVTSRGNRREAIYLTTADRETWLSLLGDVCRRFNWACHAWCQMTNHYHLVIETPDANLAAGMRQLNGVYTQRVNQAHRRTGHVFQGRYRAILVEKDAYLLELARYVVLNPVRARMVGAAEQWQWSSYQTMIGMAPTPDWMRTDWLLGQFSLDRNSATARYEEFVRAGIGRRSVWEELKGQIYLGSERFVEEAQRRIDGAVSLDEIPRSQRRPLARPLETYAATGGRSEAMARAYLSGRYSLAEIARHFGVHYSTVSRAVRAHEVQPTDNP